MGTLKKSSHYLIALFVSLIAGFFFTQSLNYTLLEPDALMGISTFEGIDVSSRIRGFYQLLTLVGICFLILVVALKKWNSFSDHSWSLSLAVLGILNITYSFYNPENIFISLGILGVLLSTFISIVNESNRLFYLLASISITLFVTYFIRLAGVQLNSGFTLFIWSILLVGFLVWDKISKPKISINTWRPILLLPVIEALASEIYLILNQREIFITTPFGWVMALLLGLAIWLFIILRNQTSGTNSNDQGYVYFFVFSLAVFSFYKPFYSFWGDLFELANPANAMMRHFVFGEYPFVDYFSSHVLFEQIPQWLYVVLNGYSPDVSFMVYGATVNMVGLVVSFWFVKQILSTEWALILVFLFPYSEILLPPTFLLGLVTIKLLYNYYREQSPKNLHLLLLWILFITLWRIDFGASIIPAVTVIFLLEWFQNKSWNSVKQVLIHVGIFSTGLLALAFLFNLLSDGKLFTNLPLALEYLGASQAHAYTHLTKKFTTLFYLHYYIFPMLTVVLLIQNWISNWNLNNRLSFYSLSVTFLGLIYLFNAQRGLVRHSFYEEYDLYISSVFFLFLSVWALRFFTHNRGLQFTAFSFIIILGFHYSNHGKPNSFGNSTLSKTTTTPIPEITHEKINRVQITDDFDVDGYQHLSNFINVNLKPDETFLDFSHTPMLYFQTQRRVPSYFNQYMQNTVTPKLLHQNAESLKDIGLVVYGRSPRNPIDYLDGIPNELRYLPVTEYIFDHFSPFTIVNGFRIWMPKSDSVQIEDPVKMLPVHYDHLKTWPSYLGRTMPCEPKSEVILAGKELILLDHQPNIHDAFAVEFKEIPKGSNHSGWVQYYNATSEIIGSVEFNIYHSGTNANFIIPIGYQYNWNYYNIAKVELHYPEHLTIKSINLVSYEP